jgi:uncharacterized membrane protein YdjX (TVP38/TMEM64 family)
VGLLYLLGRISGISEWLEPEQLRARVQAAGPWGPVAFMALFVGAVIFQIPAIPFVLAAPALFPWSEAWLWCMLAGNLSVSANFALIRKLGGQPLSETERPWLRNMLKSIDRRPVRTVALVRMATIMLPPVTSALALTGLSARNHFVGSLIGLPLPISLLVGAASWLVS